MTTFIDIDERFDYTSLIWDNEAYDEDQAEMVAQEFRESMSDYSKNSAKDLEDVFIEWQYDANREE